MSRRAAERVGRRAEAIAALWLQLRGWRIVARRWQAPASEIDLVARRGRTLLFVEVKYRPTMAMALAAITPAAHARLQRATAQSGGGMAARLGIRNATIRLDLVALAPFSWPQQVAMMAPRE
jgi:putative endonuclease